MIHMLILTSLIAAFIYALFLLVTVGCMMAIVSRHEHLMQHDALYRSSFIMKQLERKFGPPGPRSKT